DAGKIRDIQRYAKVSVTPEPALAEPSRREAGRDRLLDRVKPLLGGDLGASRRRVERWMEEGYSSLDLAAALLELAEGR
ncbi:MAG TPA: hypothetical protein VK450_02585, partial [Methanomicrobiales archaeon]|nr:hypothetical protein [Methanomicrobiales archaeon]